MLHPQDNASTSSTSATAVRSAALMFVLSMAATSGYLKYTRALVGPLRRRMKTGMPFGLSAAPPVWIGRA